MCADSGLPSKSYPKGMTTYDQNGSVQWPGRFSSVTGGLQSNTFLQPLLGISFYGTVLCSVYTTEATIGSSSAGDIISSC